MSHELRHVAIDARMIRHSGIGTALRGLLGAWQRVPPPFEITLLGSEELLASYESDRFHVVPYHASIYGLGPILLPPPLGEAQVVLSMHYAAPVLLNRPLVCVVHDLIHITHPTKIGTAAYMRARLAMLRSAASYIVTPSRHTKVQLQTLHRFPAHRVLTVPWGPGLQGVEVIEPSSDEKFSVNRPYLLAVGINKPHKNWPFLIERFAHLCREHGLALDLVAAGLGREGRVIDALAEQHGIKDRVIVAPHLSDRAMANLYHNCHALIAPSLAEGFGFPIIEAMKSGVPIVVANLPPMNELAGNAAVRFEPDLPSSFDAAVLLVVNDARLRAELGLRGRQRAEMHSWTKCAEQFTMILQRALIEKRPS